MNEKSVIEIVDPKEGRIWKPVQGEAFTNLLKRQTKLSDEEKKRLTEETISILQECSNPNTSGAQNTGLIIGYVQSGKTLSFTGLSALAKDNGYKIVIILAGTTNNLVEQSRKRLNKDLDIDNNREWSLFSTQQNGFKNDELERVKSELLKWKRGRRKARPILIVAMKQHNHLSKLAKLLKDIDLSDTATLIIDDEGDQAGMNTKARQQEESTTYTRIKTLKHAFPHHSYLLYTATPQAPLLASRIDSLSPDFGKVLTPGDQYTGGKEFFIDGLDKLVELIPSTDVPDRTDPPDAPPLSLLAAMQDFFNGVAIGFCLGEDNDGKNRSMMVHPAVPKDEHLMYSRWIKKTKDRWADILDDKNHPEHGQLIQEFQSSFIGLEKTASTGLKFSGIADCLWDAIKETAVKELNTRENKSIQPVDWGGEYSWILVGGIGLDRGFTVEGLTVSYLPRSIGVGNADNIQQRARFFGYKKKYLGLCRIYLTSENIDAFSNYVVHEEAIRSHLKVHLDSGKTLKEWRREFPLHPSLRPTRNSVVLLDMYQSRGRGGFYVPNFPHSDSSMVAENREVVVEISKKFSFSEHGEHGWNENQNVPEFSDQIYLADLVPYIWQFKYPEQTDRDQHLAMMLGIESLLSDNPKMLCSYYAFSGPWCGTPVFRTLSDSAPHKIKNLFQGSNKTTNYPGARSLVSHETVTFQLHRYDIRTANHKRTLRDVPVLATNIPEHLARQMWIERK